LSALQIIENFDATDPIHDAQVVDHHPQRLDEKRPFRALSRADT
jgi:hypothetical protein